MSRSVPHRALILAAVVTFGMVCGLLKTTIRSYRASPTTNMRWDTIPYAYYEPNKKRLKAVSVDGGHGPVSPSRETVENGAYQPLSRPMFIYVNAKSAAKAEVKRFVEFYMTQAPTLVPQLKYVPVPREAYDLAPAHFKNGKLGTAFQRTSTIGLKIEDLLRREAKL